MREAVRRRLWVVLLGVAVEGGLILLAWPLGWLLGQPPLASFHWSGGAAGLGVAATLPMLAMFLVTHRWPLGPLGRIRQFLEEVVQPLLGGCSVLELGVLSLFAGVGEEMVFRGVLQPWFVRWLGLVPGLVVTSVAFGLLHPITATYVVLAAVLGLYLGLVAWSGDNLLVVMVAHAVYDWVVLTYLLRGVASSR
jgi:membrane protease YdiL (CAAX protease family)